MTLPTLANQTLSAGAPLNLALNGLSSGGNTVTYAVSVTNAQLANSKVANPQLTATVPQGNPSLKITVDSTGNQIHGDLILQLFQDLAPQTVAKITDLVNSHFYDGLIFHRVIEDFMVQGGDPQGTGSGGPGFTFEDEFTTSLAFTSSGVLAMANSGSDTNGSQFFITTVPTRHLDFNHTIFGFLTQGGTLLDQIQSVPTNSSDKPTSNVVMSSLTTFTDTQNGVLRLAVPDGTTGSATVTVTATDSVTHETATRTFQVTVQADTGTNTNSPPFLGPMAAIYTTVNTPVVFDIPATDVEGDAIFYSGSVTPANSNLTLSVNSSTGRVTLTPASGVTGNFTIKLSVGASSSSTGSALDDQMVSVHVLSASGNTAPTLTPASPSLGRTAPGAAEFISLAGSFLNNGTGTTTIADTNQNAVIGGIALTGVTGGGTWAYSIDGTNFTSVGSVSTTSSLLLPKEAKLRYTASSSGENATISYRAWDATSGTAGAKVDTTTNGGTTAFSAATDTAALAVTTAPVLTAASPSLGTTDENTAKTVSLTGSFINNGSGTTTITDTDAGAVIGGIALTGLTGNGVWAYSTDGTTFTAVGTVSNTSALLLPKTAQLRYTPDAKNAETATITYRAWDTTSGTAGSKVDTTAGGGNTAFSTATDTASLTVTAVNDAPVVTPAGPSLGTTAPGTAKTISLTGSFINNGTGSTVVADADTGAVVGGIALTGVTGNGTWAYSTDGTTFTAVGTVSTTAALLLPKTAQLRYTPPSGTDTESATITYRAWDTTTGTAGSKVDATTNGNAAAFSAATDTATLAVNNAPVLTAANPALGSTDENTAEDILLIGSFLNNGSGTTTIADNDTGAVVGGIALTGVTGAGTWSYSTDGTTFTNVGTVSGSSALLLNKNAKLRYTPDNANGETATITYRAWDTTTGANGGRADLSTSGATGGATAFSSATDTASLTVTAVNDAPVLTPASPSLGGTTPGTAKTISLTGSFLNNGAGTTAITDADTAAVVGGIALTGFTGGGTWAYSTDGTTFTAVGTVSTTSALLLPKTAQLRYTPATSGSDAATITYRAWDTTTGTAGTKVDTTTNGGATAFSAATDTASLAVNNAPVLTAASPSLGSTDENTAKTVNLTGSFINNGTGTTAITDTDTGAVVGGIAVTGLTGNGTWAYSTNGTTFTNVGTVSASSALLLPKTAQLRYTPDAKNGETATITYRAWDTTSGTAGNKVDTTTSGSGTAFSTATDTASLTVTSVNDAPVLTSASPSLGTITSTDAKTISLTGSFLNNGTGTTTITDADTGAVIGGIALTGLTGGGTWAYSTDGTTFTAVGTVSGTSALLLPKTAQLRYTPSSATDTGSITYRAWDTSTGTAGTKVDTTTNGNATAFSTTADTASLTAGAANHAPVLTAASPNLGSITSTDAKTISLTGSFLNNGTGTTTITDSDSGAVVGGIALTGLTGGGTWAYSTDGTTFTAVGTVSTTSALLLPKTAQLRYTPSSATDTGSITYRAWDTTTGTAGSKVDTTTSGNATAFSTTTDTASFNGAAGSGSLAGFVYVDNNNDGKRMKSSGAAHLGMPGVPVRLLSQNNQGNWVDVAGKSPTLSGADGSYRFTGLAAGTYRIQQDDSYLPQFLDGIDSAGSLGGTVSRTNNIDVIEVQIASGASGTEYNFGQRGVIPGMVSLRAFLATTTSSSETFTHLDAAPKVDLTAGSSGTGRSTTYQNGGSAIAIAASDATITDADSPWLASMTVKITNANVSDTEKLEATLPSGLTSTYAAGALKITGVATLSDYRQALTTVKYSNAASSTLSGTRSISVVVNDGITDSAAALATVTVTASQTSGYTISADDAQINATEASSTGFTFAGAQVGSTYNYTVSSSGGGTAVTGSGTITSATQHVTGINVSTLSNGTLTYSVTLTPSGGTAGPAATATATLDKTAPTGYSITAKDSQVTSTNATATGFTFAGAEVGATYSYTVTSSGGGTAVTGSGTITSATQQVANINVSTLSNGTLTYSVTLTDSAGNAGTAVTATATLNKSTSPSGYTITAKDSQINAAKATATGFTFAGAQVGTTYHYTVSSSGGGTAVTGSGTVTSATQSIANINVSTLSDGTLTYSVTLTDTSSNTGPAVTATATLDRSSPTGYTITANDSLINAAEATATGITFAGAQVGSTYNYTVTSSGGGTAVTGNGTITSANQSITNINVSTLTSGTLTYSVTLTDLAGNVGSAVTTTATLDKVAPTAAITPNAGTATTSPITFTITFSEAVTGVDITDLEAHGSTSGALSLSNFQAVSTTVYKVDVSGMSTSGENVALKLTASGSGIKDTALNALTTDATASVGFNTTASTFGFTTSAQTLTAGVTSGTITVQLRDAFGNPVIAGTGGQPVTLVTGSTAGTFRNADDTADITSVTIPAGSNSVSFKYKDTQAGTAILTASANGLTSATQQQTVNAAAAARFGFTTTAQTLTAGVTSGTITVQLRDAFGNPVNAGTGGQTVTLASSSTGGAFRNAEDTADITSVTIPAGSNSVSFKYKDTVVGTPTLTASATGLTLATQQQIVNAAVAAQFGFTTAVQTLTAGVTSNTITIQLQDASGNAVNAGTGGVVVNLASSNSATGKFRNTDDTADITSVTIPAGSNSVSFKYKDTLAGTATLTASATGLTSATQQETVNAAGAHEFAFTTAAQTLTAGVTSNTITIQLRDAFGNAVNAAAGGQIVNLTTSSAGKFRNTDDSADITTVTIPAGAGTVSFKYKDTLAGTPTLTVSGTIGEANPTSTLQLATVNAAAAAKFAFTTPARTFAAGATSETITIQLQDQFGNAVNAGGGGQAVTLATSSTGGTFRNADDTADIAGITIPAGSNSISFKYKDSVAGTPILTISADGLTQATQQETVTQ